MSQKLFEAFDMNKSGSISLMEFLDCFKPSTPGLTSQVDRLMQQITRSIYNNQGSLRYLFYQLDTSGDGMLSREEFREGLRAIAGLESSTLTDSDIEMVCALPHPMPRIPFTMAPT